MANRAEQSRKEILASASQGPEIVLYLARHGATRMNAVPGVSVDRERGWSNVPLTAEGAEEARQIALKLKDKGIGAIECSDLPRAQESSDIVGKILDLEPHCSFKLRPWDLGKLTTRLMKEAAPQIAAYAKKPNVPVEGGESFNEFRRRAFQGIAEAVSKNLGKTVLLVCHLRIDSLLRGWHAAGQPISHGIDIEAFLREGELPGGIRTFRTYMPLLRGELPKKMTHAEVGYRRGTDPEYCKTCEYSDHAERPTCALVEDISRMGWCRLWDEEKL